MKKIKFEKKLSLNKETVVKLNDEQMNHVQGGGTILTTWYNCPVVSKPTASTGCPSNFISECIVCGTK